MTARVDLPVRPVVRSGSRRGARRIPAVEVVERALSEDVATSWAALRGLEPVDERDALLTLLCLHELWMAPLTLTRGRERHQSHPSVVDVKRRVEAYFLDQLARYTSAAPPVNDSDEAVAAMRRIAAADLVPAVYDWLSREATWEQLVTFLAFEGGPDAGFDDLVALAQVGISGTPKVTLAANYWDEMGRGSPDQVHTELHHQLVRATGMPLIPRSAMPSSALARVALGGVLATNRWLQPELIGALGLLEMQAGPRCRAVLKAFDRLDAPKEFRPFYEEHATADPRHGKEWLDQVIAPLAQDPEWARRMVRGARWRHAANHRFFTEIRTVVLAHQSVAD